MVDLDVMLTCPNCNHQRAETMPTDRCVLFYKCVACKTLGPPEPDAWIPERIVFPILVALNIIALLGLIATLKLRAKTST
jgi:hypothetical protein